MRPTSAGSNVAPRADPHGNNAAVTLVKLSPRPPTGPSVTRIAGTPWSGRAGVLQASWPAVSAARSLRSSSSSRDSYGPGLVVIVLPSGRGTVVRVDAHH